MTEAKFEIDHPFIKDMKERYPTGSFVVGFNNYNGYIDWEHIEKNLDKAFAIDNDFSNVYISATSSVGEALGIRVQVRRSTIWVESDFYFYKGVNMELEKALKIIYKD